MSHDEAFELLPWAMNGTLGADERELVDSHVASCLICRSELKSQAALQTFVKEQPMLSWSAERSFDRLAQRLDKPCDGRTARPGGPLRLAAAFALVATVGALVWLGTGPVGDRATAVFTTLTQNGAAQALLVDLVFGPDVSVAEIGALVRDLDATVVAGPSAVGRYTIRLNAEALRAEGRDALLTRLQSDPRVRFASSSFIAGPDEQ